MGSLAVEPSGAVISGRFLLVSVCWPLSPLSATTEVATPAAAATVSEVSTGIAGFGCTPAALEGCLKDSEIVVL